MNRKVPLFLAAGALALAGCTDPYAPRQPGQPSNAQSGAVAGALMGGFLGAMTAGGDDELAKTAAGAIVGGAIGGGIGTMLDRQEAELRRDLGNDRVRIVNTGSELVVTMPQDILFDTDSTVVRGDLQSDLYVLADNLRAYPNSRIEVVGHTDHDGSPSYNLGLSKRRANAVASVLMQAGVAPGRIIAIGRGEAEPIASNLTEAGKAQNRRVEIVIRPTA